MNFRERADAANQRMMQISEWIDQDSEAARLQGAALAGVLLGGWVAAGAVEMGYSPIVTASIMTIGTAAAIAIRMTA